jgi:chemotaxis protein methyltransferase CheR
MITAAAHPVCHDPDFPSLKQHVIDVTGLAYYADKDGDFAARIGPRLSHLALKSCGAYLALLRDREAGEAERHLLIGQLTIGETYFFRHTEQFDALRDVVLPDLIKRNEARRTLRVWSAGCAIGAEPYSLAILLKTHFARQLAGWDVRILGTDINQTFLSRAARGEFDERALRSTPDDVKRAWFSHSGRTWIVSPAIREWVSFQYHNLVEHPYPSILHGIAALDLILCRNVMIYFDWSVIQRILGQFHECLVDGGWLAVGHAESNTEVFRAYRTINVPGATLYQKSGDHHEPGAWPVVTPPAPTARRPAVEPQTPWSPFALPVVPEAPAGDVAPERAAPALSGLALIRRLADEGKWPEAAKACDELLEHDRLNPAAHFYQALIMEQVRRPAGAEQSLRRALYLDRGFVFAHYHLALLLRKTGHRDAAVQSLRNVETLLAGQRGDQLVAEADGLTVDELAQLTAMHLDLLQK